MTEQNKIPWHARIGPGLITACVVIGPGSIVAASRVGAEKGYSMLWVVALSVFFMGVYMVLGAKLGLATEQTPGDLIRDRAGKWLAVLVGISVFLVVAAFQSVNNIGVASAFAGFVESERIVTGLVIVFNIAAIAFLFAFQNLYKVLEKLMTALVGAMLLCFAVNLFFLRPSPAKVVRGFVPSGDIFTLDVLALIGTTFSVIAAFYQAYLAKQKDWSRSDLPTARNDAITGAAIMGLLTVMLISTGAAGFHELSDPPKLNTPVAVAEALKSTFGSSARIIFCFGLFSAAYSSFLVNSIIGGFLLADGLGLGSQATDRWPRILSTLALLTGMSIALASMVLDFDATPTIILAQAITVLGAPLVAGVLIWLTSRRDVMGDQTTGRLTLAAAAIGFALLLGIAAHTAFNKLPAKVREYRGRLQETQTANEPPVDDPDGLLA